MNGRTGIPACHGWTFLSSRSAELLRLSGFERSRRPRWRDIAKKNAKEIRFNLSFVKPSRHRDFAVSSLRSNCKTLQRSSPTWRTGMSASDRHECLSYRYDSTQNISRSSAADCLFITKPANFRCASSTPKTIRINRLARGYGRRSERNSQVRE